MHSIRQFKLDDWLKLVSAPVLLGACLVAGYVIRQLLFRALRRWAKRLQAISMWS